jgi:hypothetical protein
MFPIELESFQFTRFEMARPSHLARSRGRKGAFPGSSTGSVVPVRKKDAMKHLKPFRRISATAVVIGMLLAMAAAPALGQPADNPLVPASGRLAGITGGQLLGEELRQLFEIPATDNPFNGAGESCLFAGSNNNVLIAWTREESPLARYGQALQSSCSPTSTSAATLRSRRPLAARPRPGRGMRLGGPPAAGGRHHPVQGPAFRSTVDH